MPRTDEHAQRAASNEDFYNSFDLDTTPYLDWAVTGLFYSALHYVDACLHEHRTRQHPRGIDPDNHEVRTAAVGRNFNRIYRHYRELKDRSEDARYNLKIFTPQDVRNLEMHAFMAVRQFARPRLGLSS